MTADPRPPSMRHLPILKRTSPKAHARGVRQSELEETFARALTPWISIPTPVREHRFAKPRRWRFDFAWPQHQVAVEIDGLVWHNRGKGRHQTVDGIVADSEKHEAAMMLGWVVYRVPGPWINTRLQDVLTNLQQLIERRDT